MRETQLTRVARAGATGGLATGNERYVVWIECPHDHVGKQALARMESVVIVAHDVKSSCVFFASA